ncbi:hypothetical protein BBP00_00009747, partial [Phytophthora kernoviae]
MFKHYPEFVIQQLGLDNCQNTIVGNAMTRSVSGGERKRVTTGEMAFGNKYVMMMDEISTGLDSAATFDIITTQHSIAKKFRKTVVEIPYVFFSTMVLMVPFYWMVGFTGATTFFAYWVHLSLHVLWQAYFGQLMAYLL